MSFALASKYAPGIIMLFVTSVLDELTKSDSEGNLLFENSPSDLENRLARRAKELTLSLKFTQIIIILTNI